MLQVFGARLENTQSDLLEDTELEFGRNMLKTALIETNISFEELRSRDLVAEILEIDPELFMIQTENTHGSGWLFFDIHDDRFWTIFSLAGSEFFNAAISELQRSDGGGLDRLWIPTGQVEEIGEMGRYEGVKISYGANEVFPDEFIDENLLFSDLNINGSGNSAKRLYDTLKSTEELDEFLALSRIKIRREEGSNWVRESVTNKGSLTTRGGNDISLHIATVEQVKDIYSSLLTSIEDHHVIDAEQRDRGARSRGAPISIEFSKPVPDVEEFLSHVVNARDPFRLMGHVRKTGPQAFKVEGLDAHNGDKISLEMSEEWIRLYLYDDACGNTALRLFTNIQQYYDPAAELVIYNA